MSLLNIFDMRIQYVNGSFAGTNKEGSVDYEQLRNSIIAVRNEGLPFRGAPWELANDALGHLFKRWFPHEKALMPVICESYSGSDNNGIYTIEVVFQAASSIL